MRQLMGLRSARAKDGAENLSVLVQPLAIEAGLGACGDTDALRDDAPDRYAFALPPVDGLLEVIRPEARRGDHDPVRRLRRDHPERLRDARELDASGARGDDHGVRRAD